MDNLTNLLKINLIKNPKRIEEIRKKSGKFSPSDLTISWKLLLFVSLTRLPTIEKLKQNGFKKNEHMLSKKSINDWYSLLSYRMIINKKGYPVLRIPFLSS